MKFRKDTPTCPCCGSKFSHNKAALKCNVCGLPDEFISLGPRLIARWRSQQGLNVKPRGGSLTRKRNKHGRQHA